MRLCLASLALFLLVPAPAFAADDDEESDDLDFSDAPSGKKIDLRDDEGQETVKPRGPGEDTAELYRLQQQKNRDLNAEDELLSWERYLEKYPKTLFRDRIDARMEDLSANLFRERVPGSDKGAVRKDAAKSELNFSRPQQWASVDPRSRLTAGVELGIPDWFAPKLTYEHAFSRELSVTAGMQQDLVNYALLGGVKYAVLKSARTGSIVTVGTDFKLYTDPSFPDLHPWIGAGQRFPVLFGLDVQAQLGADLEVRSPFATRYEAGLAAELRASEVVSAFVETSMDVKYPGGVPYSFTGADGQTSTMSTESGARFVVATFGLRFQAAKPKNADGDGRIDVGLGANVPASANYWGFYNGAVSIDGDWKL